MIGEGVVELTTGTIIAFPIKEKTEQKADKKRRSKRKDGRYQVMLDLGRGKDGKRRRQTFYGKTYHEARAAADNFKRLVTEGLDIDNIDITLKEWAERCRPLYNEGCVEATILKHDKELDALIEAFGNRKVSSIKPIELQTYLNTRAGLTSSAVSKTRQAMAYLFKQGAINGLITRNPEESLINPSTKADGSHRELLEPEKTAILAHWGKPPYGLPAVIMLFTGLRPQEVLALDLTADVDLDAEVIHINKALKFGKNKGVIGVTKTKAGVRDVPITEPLLPILRVVKTDTERKAVFMPPAGGPLTRTTIRNAWKLFIKHAGIKATQYDLRHTFATMVEDSQVVSDKTLQYWMGHKPPVKETVTKRIYVHLSAQRLAEDTMHWKEYMKAKYSPVEKSGSQMVVKPEKSESELPR